MNTISKLAALLACSFIFSACQPEVSVPSDVPLSKLEFEPIAGIADLKGSWVFVTTGRVEQITDDQGETVKTWEGLPAGAETCFIDIMPSTAYGLVCSLVLFPLSLRELSQEGQVYSFDDDRQNFEMTVMDNNYAEVSYIYEEGMPGQVGYTKIDLTGTLTKISHELKDASARGSLTLSELDEANQPSTQYSAGITQFVYYDFVEAVSFMPLVGDVVQSRNSVEQLYLFAETAFDDVITLTFVVPSEDQAQFDRQLRVEVRSSSQAELFAIEDLDDVGIQAVRSINVTGTGDQPNGDYSVINSDLGAKYSIQWELFPE